MAGRFRTRRYPSTVPISLASKSEALQCMLGRRAAPAAVPACSRRVRGRPLALAIGATFTSPLLRSHPARLRPHHRAARWAVPAPPPCRNPRGWSALGCGASWWRMRTDCRKRAIATRQSSSPAGSPPPRDGQCRPAPPPPRPSSSLRARRRPASGFIKKLRTRASLQAGKSPRFMYFRQMRECPDGHLHQVKLFTRA